MLTHSQRLPALEQWYFEASPFEGVVRKAGESPQMPMTLERFLLERRSN
jgi:catechol 2,3-dioxygenase